jgi:glycosyltransferase involved in cell wall biosynthesis
MGDRALRQVDAVLVENSWMHDYVEETASSTQTIFAPPGVDAEQFTPSDTLFKERDYILSVGRFGDPRKNAPLLFKAYAKLRNQSQGHVPSLVIAGRTAPPEKAWAVAERHGVREHITFHKDVSRDRLIDLYREAKLFLLSSDEEGLGLVLLEAMACGVPVVSTDCGGPKTVVRESHTGTLVPTGDAEALARAAASLLRDDDTLYTYGKNARQRIVEHFSEDATAQRFFAVYDELMRST